MSLLSSWSPALRGLITLVVLGLSSLCGAVPTAGELNLYTTREPALIDPLLKAFGERTGVKVNTVFLKDGLAERVASEGRRSPADVLMAVDFGNLTDLVDKGVTQSIKSPVLEQTIAAPLRDAGGHWFALSLRARTLYVARELDAKAVTYDELADAKWKGKVCIRSGQHPYNTALIAHMIAKQGEARAEQWLRGLKANLAQKPGGGDRDVARDILGGICDIGLANSYYLGLMRSGAGGPDQQKWGEGIHALLPVFAGGGTHVNVSGAAVAKYAPNKANAIKLLEFLVSDEAQAIYAEANYEYPVNGKARLNPIIAALGALTVDEVPLAEISKHRKAASLLVDKVGFDL
ncbi:extracellular solute-binding protein [Cellvibrio japonicus]|uniref:Putative Bacterial extracellular solute-binding protein n=1 Tax=Cellvibrio japonicus (strain Ueda107) TaxID=498211 RepID=B3PH25_CELJU|nr:extracellular solute-binding protein [Cellvibrio japonicus]ACE85987.1 putative Bacterial extracellular solute-binding protein [Cellvibrio japonicus Ueda107]QEI13825.1 extracellular solute-binding protein [Cellvibrio japonicus]QEI17399.1 extracellular solute-binding protein [Cellvibrio japonicus]QEI20975.1 extracellular solute-binding protein [Cellvibrio japonicus]